MKLNLRFPIWLLLGIIAIVAAFFAGFRNGEQNERNKILRKNDLIEIFAKVQINNSGNISTLAIQTLQSPNAEMIRLSGQELGDLFVDITPFRVENVNDASTTTSRKLPDGTTETTWYLSNVPAIDACHLLSEIELNASISSNDVENSITAVADSVDELTKIESFLNHLDRRPGMFKAKLLIGQEAPDGSITYFSKPHIFSIDNQTSRASIGTPTNELTIELFLSDVPFRESGF